VPRECRWKAHSAVGYSLTREDDLMFEVREIISAGEETAADLDERSLTCRFAQILGMDAGRTQLSRTHDSPFLDNRN
jgi:hypothetical protein